MALENARNCDYTVSIIRKSVVKAIGPIPEPCILTLSNLDLLSGRFPVTYFYVYHKAKHNDSSASIVDELQNSLAICLSHFYPFAGRIIPNPVTNEPEILCDNTGALFLVGQASISLNQLDFYNLNKCLEGKLVPMHHGEFPVQVQLTNYECGGIFITFTFDHALGDATSFTKFLLMWSEIARKKPLSFSPDHRRYLLHARYPPIYNRSFDESFISCSLHDILHISTPNTLLKRLYYIDAANIDRLQKLASLDGTKRTKIEAFSAYIWKIMVKAIDKEHNKKCKMGWLVDGRTRICNTEKEMENYIGNALSVAVGEASVNEIELASIANVANNVHDAISKVTSAQHFLDLIDWIECNKPGLMLAKIVLGQCGPAIVVSSGRRFPVAEVDFGFGSPVVGTVYSTIQKLGVGYINQRPGAKGDGSWTISAILWPEMIEALESDSEHVFQPMTSNHLKLL